MGAHREAAETLHGVLSAAVPAGVTVLPLPRPDPPTAGAFVMQGMPERVAGVEQEWPATGRLLVTVNLTVVAAGTDIQHLWALLDLVDTVQDAIVAAGMIDEGDVADRWQPEGVPQPVPAQTLTVTVPVAREC